MLLVFLCRHAGVHFTGRRPCFTQQVARGRALSPFTPLLQPGGSKTDLINLFVHLSHLRKMTYSNYNQGTK